MMSRPRAIGYSHRARADAPALLQVVRVDLRLREPASDPERVVHGELRQVQRAELDDHVARHRGEQGSRVAHTGDPRGGAHLHGDPSRTQPPDQGEAGVRRRGPGLEPPEHRVVESLSETWTQARSPAAARSAASRMTAVPFVTMPIARPWRRSSVTTARVTP